MLFWRALRKVTSSGLILLALVAGVYFLPQTEFFQEQVRGLSKYGVSISKWGSEPKYDSLNSNSVTRSAR